MKENRELLNEILKDIKHDMTDEEIIDLLADSKISKKPEEKYTLGQKAADSIAKFAGSWAFIFSFTAVLIIWMLVNVLLASKAFDPYPFILLNLVLSCVAAIQAPLIMMSQNRQEEKDRHRAENDYKVNLKTEIMIEDLYNKVNHIVEKIDKLEKRIKWKEDANCAFFYETCACNNWLSSIRFVILLVLINRVEVLCSNAEADGCNIPRTLPNINNELNPMISWQFKSILLTNFSPNIRRVTRFNKSDEEMVTSATYLAMSAPVFIAMPTSAALKAGESLIPSPIIITTLPFSFSLLI